MASRAKRGLEFSDDEQDVEQAGPGFRSTNWHDVPSRTKPTPETQSLYDEMRIIDEGLARGYGLGHSLGHDLDYNLDDDFDKGFDDGLDYGLNHGPDLKGAPDQSMTTSFMRVLNEAGNEDERQIEKHRARHPAPLNPPPESEGCAEAYNGCLGKE